MNDNAVPVPGGIIGDRGYENMTRQRAPRQNHLPQALVLLQRRTQGRHERFNDAANAANVQDPEARPIGGRGTRREEDATITSSSTAANDIKFKKAVFAVVAVAVLLFLIGAVLVPVARSGCGFDFAVDEARKCEEHKSQHCICGDIASLVAEMNKWNAGPPETSEMKFMAEEEP